MAGERNDPFLSVVVTTRNDNHGGNIQARTQAFADSLQVVSQDAGFTAELIVVDWNPPVGASPLCSAVKWPSNDNIQTRIVTVPGRLHDRLTASDRIPLYQMIAKNVGIRRAAGQFILATNVDVIVPPETYRLMAPDQLSPDTLYRTNRVDVAAEPVLGESDPVKRFEACEQNVVAIHARRTNFIAKRPISLANAKRALPYQTARSLVARAKVVVRVGLRPLKNRRHLSFHGNSLKEELSANGWHNNACGDFTLMHREAWEKIGGYWEFEGYSMHIDTLGIYAARVAGLRHKTLDAPLYHVEHKGGWTLQGELDGSFDAWLRNCGMPFLENDYAMAMLKKAERLGGTLYENEPTWGFRDEVLEEVVL